MFFGGNKAEALVKELDPTNFFPLEQAQQAEILEKLNAFVTTKSKLDQVVAAGLLTTFGRLVQGAHAAKVLPATHHELMRFLAIFAKVSGMPPTATQPDHPTSFSSCSHTTRSPDTSCSLDSDPDL